MMDPATIEAIVAGIVNDLRALGTIERADVRRRI